MEMEVNKQKEIRTAAGQMHPGSDPINHAPLSPLFSWSSVIRLSIYAPPARVSCIDPVPSSPFRTGEGRK